MPSPIQYAPIVRQDPRPASGFTLVELLVSIAVLAVILGIAVPSFMSTMANSRLTGAANELLAAIQQARMEALRRGMRVTLCPSDDGANCAGNWNDGWIMFTDPSAGGPAVDAGSAILARGAGLPADIQISGGGFISFTPDGMSKNLLGAPAAVTLRLCSPSKALDDDRRARDIVISPSGRAAIEHPQGITESCPAP